MNTKDKMFELLRVEELEEYFKETNQLAAELKLNEVSLDAVPTAREAFDYAWESCIEGNPVADEIDSHVESYEKMMEIMKDVITVCVKMLCVVDLGEEEKVETLH